MRKIEFAGGNAQSFAVASQFLEELAEFEISEEHLRRLTARLGHERQQYRDAAVVAHQNRALEPRYAEPPAVVAVHLDAGKIQLRAEDGRPGVRGPVWRDTKVACLASYPSVAYTTDPRPTPPAAYLEPGWVQRVCGELARVRSVASPSPPREAASPAERSCEIGTPEPRVRTAVATLGDTITFGWLVSAEAQQRHFYGAGRQAVVGDGGNWIAPLAALHFPGWTQVLDFIHLLSHLYAAATCAWPRCGTRRWRLYSKLVTAAWEGDVRCVQRHLRQQQDRLGQPPADAPEDDPRRHLQRIVGYVEQNANRMDYPRYRREGLPLTSALVESLIKQLNQRVKATDKFWRGAGAEAVLQVRAAYLSQDDRATAHYARRPLSRAARCGTLRRTA